MRLLVLVFTVLVSQQSLANLGDLFNEKTFVCTITSFTLTGDDMDVSFTWSNLKSSNKSHGGEEHTFNEGNDEIVAIGNEAWMGLAWWRGGEKIAEAVTLITERNADSRVLLVMHPRNEDERIHMDCTKP